MKAIVKLEGDNGSVPPTYYHQYGLTFFDNGKVQFKIFDDREQGKAILDETYNYNNITLDHLVSELTQLNTAALKNYNVGSEMKQIIDCRPAVHITYNIAMEDAKGQHLFNQFLILCHANLINRINQLFFK